MGNEHKRGHIGQEGPEDNFIRRPKPSAGVRSRRAVPSSQVKQFTRKSESIIPLSYERSKLMLSVSLIRKLC